MVAFVHPKILLLIPIAVILLFLIVRRDFVKLKGERWKLFEKVKVRRRIIVFALRSIAVAALLVALAQPVVMRQEISTGNPSLTILVDGSRSFDLFDRQTVQEIKEKLQDEIPIRIRSIGSQNSSALGDELIAGMLGNDNLLLVSDGRATKGRSLGDVMVVAAAINSTVNALYLNPVRSDLAVSVEGPRITTVGIDNEFLVKVEQTSSPEAEPIPYETKVMLDSDVILEKNGAGTDGFRFTRKLSEGYHQITAEITTSSANDHFRDNNIFYKTVKVEKKPKLLLVTKSETPLQGVLIPLYDVTTASSTKGTSLAGYSAAVLNDMPETGIDSEQLADFIDEGNGIVVFGGESSYDKGGYRGKPLENLLPVKVGTGEEGAKKFVNVVLLIDISGTTGWEFGTANSATVGEVEKALALGLVSDLRPEDRVGVIAFNIAPYTIVEFGKLSANKNEIISKIPLLVSQGNTFIEEGLKGARQMLAQVDGSKNIVLFSDGNTGEIGETVRGARYAAEQGIKVYTVGVGEWTNTDYMQEIAKAGSGIYFEPTEAQKLKIIFGGAEAAPTDKMKLEKLNNNHFITRNVKLNARLSGFNQVVPKPNADVLVATAENRPVLTVWRFGLGRIVSVTTDDGTGWAAELFNRDNSVLITRAVNWAIGDLGRNKKFDVTARDTYLGENFEVDVVSDQMPSHSKMTFSKTGERAYSSEFTPDKTGWHSFFDATAAANYPLELLKTGYDPDLGVLVQATGGQTFKPGQTAELLEHVKEKSKRLVTSQKSLALIPLAIAITAFLIEIAARKILEQAEGSGNAA